MKRHLRHADPQLVRCKHHAKVQASLCDEDWGYSKKKVDNIARCAPEISGAFLGVPDRPYVCGIASDASHLPVLRKKTVELMDIIPHETRVDYPHKKNVATTLLSLVKRDVIDEHPVKNVEELMEIAGPAVCGRGTETVLDPTVRKCLKIHPEDIDVQWTDGLENALSTISSVMCEPNLEAQLHDVLVYEPGSFFKEHKDSKKHPRHKMTLVVDCSFQDQHFAAEEDAREEGTTDEDEAVSGVDDPASSGGSKGGAVIFLSECAKPLKYPRVPYEGYYGGHIGDAKPHSDTSSDAYDCSTSSVYSDSLTQCSDTLSSLSDDVDSKKVWNAEPLDCSCSDNGRNSPPLGVHNHGPRTRRVGRWRSKAAGDWCAWYTSQPHKVTRLHQHAGHRVVAVFNLHTTADDGGVEDGSDDEACEQQQVASTTAAPADLEGDAPEWPQPPSTAVGSKQRLTQLPGEVLQEVGGFMSRDALLAAGRACHRLRHFLGPKFCFQTTADRILGGASLSSSKKNNILTSLLHDSSMALTSPFKRLGFVLQHQYSCDGNPFVPLRNLRGRDAVLVNSITQSLRQRQPSSSSTLPSATSAWNPEPLVVPVDIVMEVPKDRSTWFIHLLDEVEATTTMSYMDQKKYDGVYLIRYELDSSDPVVPKRRISNEDDILWLSTPRYVTTFANTHVPEASFKHLWGNTATFDVYWYRSCIVLWDLPKVWGATKKKHSDPNE